MHFNQPNLHSDLVVVSSFQIGEVGPYLKRGGNLKRERRHETKPSGQNFCYFMMNMMIGYSQIIPINLSNLML